MRPHCFCRDLANPAPSEIKVVRCQQMQFSMCSKWMLYSSGACKSTEIECWGNKARSTCSIVLSSEVQTCQTSPSSASQRLTLCETRNSITAVAHPGSQHLHTDPWHHHCTMSPANYLGVWRASELAPPFSRCKHFLPTIRLNARWQLDLGMDRRSTTVDGRPSTAKSANRQHKLRTTDDPQRQEYKPTSNHTPNNDIGRITTKVCCNTARACRKMSRGSTI